MFEDSLSHIVRIYLKAHKHKEERKENRRWGIFDCWSWWSACLHLELTKRHVSGICKDFAWPDHWKWDELSECGRHLMVPTLDAEVRGRKAFAFCLLDFSIDIAFIYTAAATAAITDIRAKLLQSSMRNWRPVALQSPSIVNTKLGMLRHPASKTDSYCDVNLSGEGSHWWTTQTVRQSNKSPFNIENYSINSVSLENPD